VAGDPHTLIAAVAHWSEDLVERSLEVRLLGVEDRLKFGFQLRIHDPTPKVITPIGILRSTDSWPIGAG
jgi:hypothetical protein